MLFKRRAEKPWTERVRDWVWPRKGWRRPGLYYVKRVLRLSGTPYAIAMGAAIGVAVSMTPLIGFHFFLTFAIAWAVGANFLAGAIATAVGNPLTFPFIWAATYELGHLLLNGRQHEAPSRLPHEMLHRPLEQLLPLVKPMMVGAVPIGLVGGIVTYLLVHKAVTTYQQARRHRLAKRRLARSDQSSAVVAEPGSGH